MKVFVIVAIFVAGKSYSYSDMVALIQSENHASNKGKTAGRYQFDTHPTGVGLSISRTFIIKDY